MIDPPRSILHADDRLRGSLTLAGDFTLDASFAGSLEVAGELEVAAGACVSGPVRVGSLVLRGRVEGDVHATGRAVLHTSARLTGKLTCGALTIEDGATLRGEVEVVPRETAAMIESALVPPALLLDETTLREDGFDAVFEVELDLGGIIAGRPLGDQPATKPRPAAVAADFAETPTDPGHADEEDSPLAADAPDATHATDPAPLPEVRIGTAAIHSALLRRRTRVLVGATARPPVPAMTP
jgi:cytoskeletal protein CcmA (bactofilin family)